MQFIMDDKRLNWGFKVNDNKKMSAKLVFYL